MGNLTTSLLGAASALNAFQYALNVTQNNIDNASTPGYARQTVALQAEPFDPAGGLSGGVAEGPLLDSRDLLVENDVWQQSAGQGDATARNESLSALQNAMPVSDGSGIPAALNNFFAQVSAWSASPTDSNVRQEVMNSANALAQSFQTTAAAVSNVSASVTGNISDTVSQINRLTTQLAALNHQIQAGGEQDASLQAKLYGTLESLSGLVDISVLNQADGTVNVTLSGGAALVVGSSQYALTPGTATPPATSTDPLAPADVTIQAADGSDVTGQITSGTLHGLLQVRNQTIPGLIGDASQPGALNLLASTLAQRVNQIVSQGSLSPGVPAATGLFAYNTGSASAAASTLAVDPNMSASQLPAIDQNGVSNGVPLALAALASPQQAADELDSVSYTAYYGNAAALVGSQLNQAQSDQDLATQTLAQAQTLRQTEEGVSLNSEAMHVLEYQQSFQAVAKMVSTLASLIQSVINMIPS